MIFIGYLLIIDGMKNVIKYAICFLVSVIFANYSAVYFANWYKKIFSDYGSYMDVRYVIGFPLAYVFFLTLLLIAFGSSKKYLWLGILLIPAVAFELYFDLAHIYFPLALGLIGWVIGFGIRTLIVGLKRK